LFSRFDRRVTSRLGGFEATLGLGEVLLELAAELLLTLQRCLRLAAIELRCLSRCALVGELTIERGAFLAGALLDSGAVCGGLGALLGAGGALVSFGGELVAALGVFGRSGGFALGVGSARLGVAGARVGLVAVALGGAGAVERGVAVALAVKRSAPAPPDATRCDRSRPRALRRRPRRLLAGRSTRARRR
jgi:hypothetical protein